MAIDRIQRIKNILSDVGAGFKADYELGREDATKMYYRTLVNLKEIKKKDLERLICSILIWE